MQLPDISPATIVSPTPSRTVAVISSFRAWSHSRRDVAHLREGGRTFAACSSQSIGKCCWMNGRIDRPQCGETSVPAMGGLGPAECVGNHTQFRGRLIIEIDRHDIEADVLRLLAKTGHV